MEGKILSTVGGMCNVYSDGKIYNLFSRGVIGDTPGFSSLELGLFKEDLAKFFPGYNKYYLECYFSNCLHQNEKQCKIKEEIDKGNLSIEGYKVYIKLLNECKFKSQRYQK